MNKQIHPDFHYLKQFELRIFFVRNFLRLPTGKLNSLLYSTVPISYLLVV